MKKIGKALSIGAAAALLVCSTALTASAEVINQNSVSTIKTTENIISSSTVYVGKVSLDGKAAVKYIYSDDFSHLENNWNDLLDALNGMNDTDFSALLGACDKTAGERGIKACSDASLVSKMDESWARASAVGEKYYSDRILTSEGNRNLYDADTGFKAKLDAQKAVRTEGFDEPIDNSKTIVSHIDSRTLTDVYYTIEDGQVVRHYDQTVIYDSEEVTVMYTTANITAKGSTSVNVKGQKATVVQDSTLYVGEVVVDGESKIKYLWSDDMTRSENVTAAVRDALNALKDKDFAALLPEIVGEEDAKGAAECSIADYKSSMDSSWKNSEAVAALYYPDKTLKASSSADLYDSDESFAKTCGFNDEADVTVVDKAGETYEARSPLGKLSAANTDTVTYTVENGVLVKYIDRFVDYTCEAVKVIYTKTELTTAAETVDNSEPEESNGPGESVAADSSKSENGGAAETVDNSEPEESNGPVESAAADSSKSENGGAGKSSGNTDGASKNPNTGAAAASISAVLITAAALLVIKSKK